MQEMVDLLNGVPTFQAVYRVTAFQCHRKRPDGSDQMLRVEIYDRGQDDRNRYSVHAKAEDGKTVSGNAHENLQEAIATVHWYSLD